MVALGGIPYLYCVDHITEIGVTHKLAEGALNIVVQVSDKEVKYHKYHLQTPEKYHCIHTDTELLTTSRAVTIHPIPHTVSGLSINSCLIPLSSERRVSYRAVPNVFHQSR